MKLNFSLYIHYCKIKTLIYKEYFVQWWLQRESNQRHTDFQSVALPTELWSQMAVLMGLEPTVYCVTGSRDNHYTTEPWLRELELNQRPLGYEPNELPDCSTPRYKNFWRRKRDSNPCAVADLLVFKTSPFNQTWVFLLLYLVPKAGLEPARGINHAGF